MEPLLVSATMSVDNRLETWSDKWSKGATGWHASDLHHALRNHASKFLPKPERRVLVPLCGKSVDLEWLYKNGHTVVGVEGVEQAIVEFFIESGLPYVSEETTWAKIFKTEDDRLKVYCCDVFKMDVESLGKFDGVWDRGSLVAIYEEDRERYAELIKSLLADDFRYMMDILQYTPNEHFNGPPRNVPTELVEKLFGDVCEMKVLETDTSDAPQWHLDNIMEIIAMLTPRK